MSPSNSAACAPSRLRTPDETRCRLRAKTTTSGDLKTGCKQPRRKFHAEPRPQASLRARNLSALSRPDSRRQSSCLFLRGKASGYERRLLHPGRFAARQYTRPFHYRFEQNEADHHHQSNGYNRIQTIVENQARVRTRSGSQLYSVGEKSNTR